MGEKEKMKDETILTLTAMLCTTTLTITALLKGYDTAILISAFTLIGSMVGYEVGKWRKKPSENA